MALQSARFLSFAAGALFLSACTYDAGTGTVGSAVLPSAMQGRSAVALDSRSRGSWMLSEAKREDLVYASDINLDKVFVLSLPADKLVGTLAFRDVPWGLCSDNAGHVFITHFHQYGVAAKVDEYDHGSSAPIVTMSLPKAESATCSVDPKTGDLAVATSSSPGSAVSISIFPPPFGKGSLPKRIDAPSTIALTPYCSYDDDGDLFLTLEQQVGTNYPQWFLDELPSGKKTLSPVNVTGIGGFTQWHGTYLAIGLQNINHVKVSGSNGKVVGYTKLAGKQRDFSNNGWGVFWIEDHVVAAPFYYPRSHIRDGTHYLIGLWNYPSGSIIKTSHDFGAELLSGVTISRSSKH
jgi:hypothetical protein